MLQRGKLPVPSPPEREQSPSEENSISEADEVFDLDYRSAVEEREKRINAYYPKQN